jgi:hypothetical protein
MADINDVRKALFNAYKKKEQSEDGIEGKSSEGWCEVLYPTFWECETIDEFLKPCGIMVYSYALGPSRQHYFMYAKKEKRGDYATWYAPDFFAKAVEVINSWVEDV